MSQVLARTPDTAAGIQPLIDLNSKEERERLSPSALKGFFSIASRWSVRDEDARVLLGGITNGPYYGWKKQVNRTVGADVLTRISYLTGIFKALHILYGERIADDWVSLPNSNRIFAGLTPLAYMKRGGIPAMQVVRRLLDARRGGI